MANEELLEKLGQQAYDAKAHEEEMQERIALTLSSDNQDQVQLERSILTEQTTIKHLE